jgi:hypothetical protein
MNGNQIVDQEARLVATANGDSHAAFIVQACNAHDSLVAACEAFIKAYETNQHWPSIDLVTAARAEVKKARGES